MDSQGALLDPLDDGRILISRDTWLRQTGDCVAVFAHGIPILSYDANDIAAARLAMVQLVESKCATQEEAARAFNVERATVYRQRAKYRELGVGGLVPKKRGPKGPHKLGGRRDKVVERLKSAGTSNEAIAQRLGVSEFAVRAALKRVGYRAAASTAIQEELPGVTDGAAKEGEDASAKPAQSSKSSSETMVAEVEDASAGPKSASKPRQGDNSEAALGELPESPRREGVESTSTVVSGGGRPSDSRPGIETGERGGSASTGPASCVQVAPSELGMPVVPSLDVDPSNRAVDRFLARMGLLQDAGPLFGTVKGVSGAGVLLAVPILVAHGVFADAMQVFGSLGAAFYGLRNTVLTLVVCFLRGINRPENLKEHSARALGQVLGLDRAPEMKTLRRKIRALTQQNRALEFLQRQARRFLRRKTGESLWLYLDGHVSVYSGEHKLAKHHVTRLRISLPSVLDYWVNDEKGDPVLVYTGERAGKGLVRMVEEVIGELRGLGEKRPVTLIFDREGWSPGLFARLSGLDGVHFITYRKAKAKKKLPRLGRREFERVKGEIDGQEVEYELADKAVWVEYGRGRKKKRLKLRQVSRRMENGHQTHVVTNAWEPSVLEIAYRMFGRWGQENFFKYMGHEKDFDGLVTYLMEEVDAERLVANPKRVELRRKVQQQQADLAKLMAQYGECAINNQEAARPTIRGFKIANGELGQEIRRCEAVLRDLEARLREMPVKVPLGSTLKKDQRPKRVHTETRQLLHCFRMVARRAETALRELLRSSYPRWREDGRTLIRTFLNAHGDIEVTDGVLQVTLDEQSAPHRTRLLAHICSELNSLRTKFPGSDLVLSYRVRGSQDVAGSN